MKKIREGPWIFPGAPRKKYPAGPEGKGRQGMAGAGDQSAAAGLSSLSMDTSLTHRVKIFMAVFRSSREG